MLFGNEHIQKELLNEVAICEREKGFKVIFGAMVGSISKGLQYYDSDYDTRFLYVNKDFPDKIFVPDEVEEKEIIYRKYFEDTPYEWIPFWEFSSFLQFLVNPMINKKFSVGLYNVVGWTFLSPYVYDPYGIQNKILPLIQKHFYSDYSIEYHKNLLESFDLNKEIIVAKDYVYALHSALTIDWINKYNEYPPIYMRTLLSLRTDLIEDIEELWGTAREEAKEYITSTGSQQLYESHYNVYTHHVERVDRYIEQIKSDVKDFKASRMSVGLQRDCRNNVQEIYSIVKRVLSDEEKVRNVSII